MRHTRVFGWIAATLSLVFMAYGTEKLAGQRTGSGEQELLATVKQHRLAKLGPWLINLYEEYQESASSPGGQVPAAFKSRNPALNVRNGDIAIEGVVNDPVAFARTLTEIGATDVHGGGILFSARVPVNRLERL